MVALAECGTHAFLAAEVGSYSVGEKTLAQRLLQRLHRDELLTADRNCRTARPDLSVVGPDPIRGPARRIGAGRDRSRTTPRSEDATVVAPLPSEDSAPALLSSLVGTPVCYWRLDAPRRFRRTGAAGSHRAAAATRQPPDRARPGVSYPSGLLMDRSRPGSTQPSRRTAAARSRQSVDTAAASHENRRSEPRIPVEVGSGTKGRPRQVPRARDPLDIEALDGERGHHCATEGPDWSRRRWWRRWLALGLAAGLAVAVLVVGAEELATPSEGDGEILSSAAPENGVSLDPARYTDDGCRPLGPLSGDRGRTVFLDPGHGGLDPGASASTGPPEKDLALAAALEVATVLRREGFRVVLSRTADSLGSPVSPADAAAGTLSGPGQRAQLSARARCANLAGADALVSLHLNSFDQPVIRGAETLYEPDRPFGAANRQLAELMQRSILRAFADIGRPVPDRGVEGGSDGTDAHDLVVLGPAAPGHIAEPSAMPGALVEPLFLTNPADAALATSVEGRRALARGIAEALTLFLAPS